MKPIDIIKKLTSIMIDSKYYHINGMYNMFIDSKIAYEKIIPAIPPKKEMTLLLRMINNLYQNIVVFNKNKERIDNNESRKLLLSHFEVIMQLVYEKLYFIYLGKIELIQQEYINLWIANNPNYKIKIWTDNNAYYAHELFSRI